MTEEPASFVSLRRKLQERETALQKSEATVRAQQLEIERLKRLLAEAQSKGAQ